MNIPDKVKIGWREYQVVQGEHRSPDEGRGDLYGEIQYERNRIYLYREQDEENKRVTLLHEIIHGIFYMTGNAMREDENAVTSLSEMLYQIIKDNPGMFEKTT